MKRSGLSWPLAEMVAADVVVVVCADAIAGAQVQAQKTTHHGKRGIGRRISIARATRISPLLRGVTRRAAANVAGARGGRRPAVTK